MKIDCSFLVSTLLLFSIPEAHSLSSPSRGAATANPTNPEGVARNIATQVLQGAGAPLVDLNQYNLPPTEETLGLWKAELVQKVGESKVVARLGTKQDLETYVDSVTVVLPPESQGLGLELVELFGGERDDRLGVTIVQDVIPGGPCHGLDVRVGDSLASVTVRTKTSRTKPSQSPQETVSQESKSTECLDYDATVEALQSILPSGTNSKSSSTQEVLLTFKRLRRKPKVQVKLQFPPNLEQKDQTLELFAGENLRLGLLRRNVQLNDGAAQRFDGKPSGSGNCGAGGLCRTCVVRIDDGVNLLNPSRPAEQQMSLIRENPRWRLSCKAIVGFGMQEGTLKLKVFPRQW